ncbi:MAG: tetraacyldisaccharide 4'-kinase [Proteobacteria bacterium]|nr:tetraacyldisaccharide 4'-kinase [Pseudomonadota bacterium]
MNTFEPSLKNVKRAGAALFGIAARVRETGYDSGLLRIHRVEGIKVVSVGNLRVGGSGKTPFAIYLAGRLRNAGISTAILSRGYRGGLENRGGLISLGDGPIVSWEDAGDEAYLAAKSLRGVRVYTGRDRITWTRHARDSGVQAVVLDDGYQHRRLHRDLDILLVCPEDLDPRTALLPAGPLRERAATAHRADIIGGLAHDWEDRSGAPEMLIDYLPTGLFLKEDEMVPLSRHQGARVYLVTGVARPKRFHQTVKNAGFVVVGSSSFKDHHRFGIRDAEIVTSRAKAKNADAICTTEKNVMSMAGLKIGLPLWALRIEIEIKSGGDLLSQQLNRAIGT